MNKVCVIGDGGWGTALAILLQNKGIETLIWSISPEYAGILDKKRENVKFLKDVTFPDGLTVTADVEVASKADYAVFAVPCEHLSAVARRFSGASFTGIISATKGIETGSLRRPSEILSDVFDRDKICVLSGPSIAIEVARLIPTTVVIAGKSPGTGQMQRLFTAEHFRVYTSADMIGVELGGALKNIIAIASGISDGLGFGTNSKAAILTRGLAEITRLGVRMGALKETFSGLSGIGDLATTCISLHSRNRWFGEQLGRGRETEEILKDTEMVVEGVSTCKSAYALAKKVGVDMPITEKVYEVIYRKKDPKKAVIELMTRELKKEEY